MEIELSQIRNFVGACYPFELLSDASLAELTQKLQVRYLARANNFPESGSEPCVYIVRTGAIAVSDAAGKLASQLGEGDIYKHSFAKFASDHQARTLEDTLYYSLPCSYLETLLPQHPAFAAFFAKRVQINPLADQAASSTSTNINSLAVAISTLVSRPPVTTALTTSIAATAQLMTANKVSAAILVADDDQRRLIGIVTDRDIRSRCVAAGLDPSQPVSSIMTPNPQQVQKDELALHAMLTMTRNNINHLPVLDGDRIIGMFSSADISRHSGNNPLLLTSAINKANSVDELAQILQQLPKLQVLLNEANVSAQNIGAAMAFIADNLTSQLIKITQRRIGPEPVAFVWVACGSQARKEQTSFSDQDNALIYHDNASAEHQQYFLELARAVSDGLNACGYVYCPGKVMASNPQWCQPLATWQRYFGNWVNKPDPEALLDSSIFFDMRAVHGDFELLRSLRRETLRQSKGNWLFTAHMAANALKHQPPLGFFRNFVLIQEGEHHNSFNVKLRGTAPISDIARVLSLAQGIDHVATTSRLRALKLTPALDDDTADNLLAGWEFICSLKIHHQAQQISSGAELGNFLNPESLSGVDRKYLKDIFAVVKDVQAMLASDYKVGQLG